MTDKEIIKALEYCVNEVICNNCPVKKECTDTEYILEKAFNLINRQQAEIDRLNKEVDRLSQCVLYHEGQIVDAVKDFAERLKANMSNIARMEYAGNTYFCVGYGLIDNLVKEMTEN